MPWSSSCGFNIVNIEKMEDAVHDFALIVDTDDAASAHRANDSDRRHMSLPMGDGDVPDALTIQHLVEAAGELDDSQALLVNGSDGLNSSCLLACCHIINRYDVSGSALLGWVRIARPGAIATISQERFLCALGGAADLEMLWTRRAQQQCCALS